MLTIGSVALLYLIVYGTAVVPLMGTPADGSAPWSRFASGEWIVSFAYIPSVIVASNLTTGPIELGTWLIMLLFGVLWGTLLFLVGKAIREIAGRKTLAELSGQER